MRPAGALHPAGRSPIPTGARTGDDKSPEGGSPLAPNTGRNTEPFPAGATPIEGAPETGDGLDGTLEGVLDAGASPITIGQDAIGLLGGL